MLEMVNPSFRFGRKRQQNDPTALQAGHRQEEGHLQEACQVTDIQLRDGKGTDRTAMDSKLVIPIFLTNNARVSTHFSNIRIMRNRPFFYADICGVYPQMRPLNMPYIYGNQ